MNENMVCLTLKIRHFLFLTHKDAKQLKLKVHLAYH